MEYTWETHTIRTGKGSLISEFGPMCEEVLFNCTNVSFQFYVKFDKIIDLSTPQS